MKLNNVYFGAKILKNIIELNAMEKNYMNLKFLFQDKLIF